MSTNVFGFSLLRNGVKYDYSFKECFSSLEPLCDQIYLALGDSEDSTEEEVKKFTTIKCIPTTWDLESREGGLVLSEQTNIALEALRKDHGHEGHAWGIYLQCDEVFHEDDYDLIKLDIEKADSQGCDAIRFRYLHFWQSHHQIAINKKWYPQEIRAVKLGSNIESWGDAQSFRNTTKIYESDARIFHYGHVRDPEQYKIKKRDMLKLYHEDNRLKKYRQKEKKFDDQTECLDYWGPHPRVMKDRIERLGEKYLAPIVDSVCLISRETVSEHFLSLIRAQKKEVVMSWSEAKAHRDAIVVELEPTWWRSLFTKKTVPAQMRSPLARTWPSCFYKTLLLSQKGVGVNSQSSLQT